MEWIAIYKALTEEQRKILDKLVKILSEVQEGASPTDGTPHLAETSRRPTGRLLRVGVAPNGNRFLWNSRDAP